MISLDDCIAMCGLSEDEVLAIAEHEHVPEIVATSIARSLMDQPLGPAQVRNMMIDNIRHAVERRDMAHANELLAVLRHYLDLHPQARIG